METYWATRSTKEKLRTCVLYLFVNREENKISVNDIVKMTGVPRGTIYANAKDR
ncbi:hypothetical protein MZM54_27655 [[Brevibacterium] frigoritolerans]|nr:hypothetical protein [Peribacillus frigoritolerans]